MWRRSDLTKIIIIIIIRSKLFTLHARKNCGSASWKEIDLVANVKATKVRIVKVLNIILYYIYIS